MLHNQARIDCWHCDKYFSLTEFMMHHLNQHNGEKSHFCKVCGYLLRGPLTGNTSPALITNKLRTLRMSRDKTLYPKIISQARSETRFMKLKADF